MATATLIPSGYSDLTGMSIDSGYPIGNAYANSSSTNYARFNISQSTTGSVYFLVDTSSIPANATNISITAQFKARVSNTTRVTNTGCQLYSGTTAKGSSTAFGATTASVRSMDPGSSWTRTDLNDLRIYVTGRASSSSSSRRIDFYGADIAITYTAGTVHVTSVSVTPTTASIEMSETLQLTETVLPADATDKSVSWSSSNTSVATVLGGVVTGVSAGSATITVTTTDGGYTATCAVTVTPAVLYEYEQANTLEPGKQYLIANGNSGSVYILSNESGGSRLLKGVSATVSNGHISITGAVKSKCEFDCELYDSNNSITTVIKSGNAYLYSDSGTGLRFYETASMNRWWHLNGAKFWLFKNNTTDGWTDTSSEYKYYLEVSSGNFTDNHLTSPAVADTTLPAMYLFTPYVASGDTISFKENGSWVEANKVWKKVSGSWVEQTDLTNVFDPTKNYVKG